MRKLLVVAAVVGLAVVGIEGCGQSSSSFVGANGGEVCIEGKICITVPPGALEDQVLLKITEGAEAPPAAIGESYEISPSGTQFLKAATVSIRYDFLMEDAGFDPFILKVFTKDNGDWVPLGSSVVDRVRTQVTGKTTHLSPFVLLRSDLLPDGGMPMDFDAGYMDAGDPIKPPPPPDAGPRDSGMPPDAGPPDSGRPDAGPPDAGRPDAGPPDAGRPDAGPPDAGPPDAGPPDAGPPDAGPPDAGPPDAGPPDAGPPDAGAADAGDPDAGDGG